MNAGPNGGVLMFWVIIGIKKRWGLSIITSTKVFMVSLIFRVPGFIPKVPFSNVCGFVLIFLQGFPNRDFGTFHPVWIGWAEQFSVFPTDIFRRVFLGCSQSTPLEKGPYPVGHPEAVRITTGLHCCTGGRAYRTGGISIGKKYSLLGQPVHIRSPVKVRSLTAQVHPAHVIDKDQNNIWFGTLFGGICIHRAKKKAENG